MNIIKKYFPLLSKEQESQFRLMYNLYHEKNQLVNIISRKDIQHLYLHHVLHSLSIARQFPFKAGRKILDLGTGGGFPGIPLAIMFPECKFKLIDGTHKKINIVKEVAQELGLKNVSALPERAEYHSGKYDFVVSRAVAKISVLWAWVNPLLKSSTDAGLICLKGGNIEEELKALPKHLDREIFFINKLFDESYFDEKFIVYIQHISYKSKSDL